VAKQDNTHLDIESSQPVKPNSNPPAFYQPEVGKRKWATLIAKIFGAIPVICSHCKSTMDLKEFVFDDKLIQRAFPYITKAPPKRQFEKYDPDKNESTYSLFSVDPSEDINQSYPEYVEGDRQWNEDDFNQEISW